MPNQVSNSHYTRATNKIYPYDLRRCTYNSSTGRMDIHYRKKPIDYSEIQTIIEAVPELNNNNYGSFDFIYEPSIDTYYLISAGKLTYLVEDDQYIWSYWTDKTSAGYKFVNGIKSSYTYTSGSETIWMDSGSNPENMNKFLNVSKDAIVFNFSSGSTSTSLVRTTALCVIPKKGNETFKNDSSEVFNGGPICTNGASLQLVLDKAKILNDFTADSLLLPNELLISNSGYSHGQKVVGTMPNNGALSYTPSTSQQTIPAGYTSGGTISAVTSAIDQNIQAGNIKNGVTILGVEGTYDGPSYDTNLVLDSLDAGGAEQYLGGTPITDITNVGGFNVFNADGDSILYYVMKTVTATSNMTGFSMNNIRVLDNGIIQWIPYGNNTVFNTDDYLECTITCTDAYNNTETKIIMIYNSEKENYPGPDDPGPDDPGEI